MMGDTWGDMRGRLAEALPATADNQAACRRLGMSVRSRLQQRARGESGIKPGGIPIAWYIAGKVRCENDHVSSKAVPSTTRASGGLCPRCASAAWTTFPEDKDGPLP